MSGARIGRTAGTVIGPEDGTPVSVRFELRIPKLRTGSYFPEWLLDARTRSERAFVQVVTEAYVRGISTRRVEGLVEALGVTSLSKSQVSELARELDQTVSEFRNRPLDSGPYTYVRADALVVKPESTDSCSENQS